MMSHFLQVRGITEHEFRCQLQERRDPRGWIVLFAPNN